MVNDDRETIRPHRDPNIIASVAARIVNRADGFVAAAAGPVVTLGYLERACGSIAVPDDW